MPTKEELIESLYKVICSATHTRSDARVADNDYFKRRVLGFGPEIAFENAVNEIEGASFLEGGQFISTKLTGEAARKNSFIYTTVSSDDPAPYGRVYAALANWDEVGDMWYIKILHTGWVAEDFDTREAAQGPRTVAQILTPAYEFFRFSKENLDFERTDEQTFKTVLSGFGTVTRAPALYPLRFRDRFAFFETLSEDFLMKIYGNRYFLDVILRKAKGRQIIDLDGFLLVGEKITIVEIKEKSPILNDSVNEVDWQYGWDSRRLIWYYYLQEHCQLPVLYNIHRIHERTAREFVQWDSIFLNDFMKGVGWSGSRAGGGGEDTLLAPYSYFRRLSAVITELLQE